MALTNLKLHIISLLVGTVPPMGSKLCGNCVYNAVVLNQVIVRDLDPENKLLLAALTKRLLEETDVFTEGQFKIIRMSRLTQSDHLTYEFDLISGVTNESATGVFHLDVREIQMVGYAGAAQHQAQWN